jgi:hypothetical protein
MDMKLALVPYEGPDLNGMMFEVSEHVETIQIGNPIINLYKFEARRGYGRARERPPTRLRLFAPILNVTYGLD